MELFHANSIRASQGTISIFDEKFPVRNLDDNPSFFFKYAKCPMKNLNLYQNNTRITKL